MMAEAKKSILIHGEANALLIWAKMALGEQEAIKATSKVGLWFMD